MSDNILDKTTRALQSSMSMRQLRQNVLNANIANAETPGYVAKKVDFGDALARAIDLEGLGAKTQILGGAPAEPGHIAVGSGSLSRVRADVYDNPDGSVNNDGNTVDLEREMTQLAENSVLYKAAIQLINKKLAALKYAASEGR